MPSSSSQLPVKVFFAFCPGQCVVYFIASRSHRLRFACLILSLSFSLSFSPSFSLFLSLSPCLAYSISTHARFYLYVIFLVCQLYPTPSPSLPAVLNVFWHALAMRLCVLPSFLQPCLTSPFSLSCSHSCYRLHSFACGCRFLLLQICCSSNGNLLLTTAAAAMQTRMCSHAHTRTHMHRHARTHTGD